MSLFVKILAVAYACMAGAFFALWMDSSDAGIFMAMALMVLVTCMAERKA